MGWRSRQADSFGISCPRADVDAGVGATGFSRYRSLSGLTAHVRSFGCPGTSDRCLTIPVRSRFSATVRRHTGDPSGPGSPKTMIGSAGSGFGPTDHTSPNVAQPAPVTAAPVFGRCLQHRSRLRISGEIRDVTDDLRSFTPVRRSAGPGRQIACFGVAGECSERRSGARAPDAAKTLFSSSPKSGNVADRSDDRGLTASNFLLCRLPESISII